MTDTQISDERIERAAIALWIDEGVRAWPRSLQRTVALWHDNSDETRSMWRRMARTALETDAPAFEAARAEGLRDGLIWAADKARTLKTLRVWLPTGDKPGEGEAEHVTIHGIEIAEAIEARLSEMDRQPVNEGG